MRLCIGRLFVALVVSLAVGFASNVVLADGENTTSASGGSLVVPESHLPEIFDIIPFLIPDGSEDILQHGNIQIEGNVKATKFEGDGSELTGIGSWSQKLLADERFELVLDGAAVLDKETGLVWEQSPTMTAMTWISAISHCYTREVGGRKGWHLPTVEQLASLVDTTQGSLSLPSGHPFSNVQSSYYWSATTYAFNTTSAWGVDFNFGGLSYSNKPLNYYVWCVRGGQVHDAY